MIKLTYVCDECQKQDSSFDTIGLEGMLTITPRGWHKLDFTIFLCCYECVIAYCQNREL